MKNIITLILIVSALKINAQSGITWGMGMNVAPSTSGNQHPRMTLDRSGNPMLVWHHSSRAMFSRWNGTAFTTPVMVNPMNITVAGATWMGPDIASHGDTVYVVYKQTPEAADTCNIFCVRSFNGGMTFSAPVQVDNIVDSISRFPTVTTDALGNPIVAFMKFDASFGDARWVVAKSTNFGTSFLIDHQASGWSSMTSTVCDCCPGAVVCEGNTVAMMYRDNNSNYRDTWAGISTNAGSSFAGGMGIDQQNWMLMSCPSSGPDGVIIGDTLYSVNMNGASGTNRTYFNKSSISSMTGSAGTLLTGSIAGLTQQNFPRIASDGSATAIVWTQMVSGNAQLPLLFTNNIANGFPALYDTVDLSNITNADVAVGNGKVFVVWEDDGSGTIKYRSGTFSSITRVNENKEENLFSVYPNPASDKLQVLSSKFQGGELKVFDVLGESIFQSTLNHQSVDVSGLSKGIYFIQLKTGNEIYSQKFIKQ